MSGEFDCSRKGRVHLAGEEDVMSRIAKTATAAFGTGVVPGH
ncbi:hypothetical protein AB0420_04010 [Streptomyces caelestis]